MLNVCVYAQTWSVSGRITEAGSEVPVIGAVVRLGSDYLWTTADSKGEFTFKNVQPGKYDLEATCLGYVNITVEIDGGKASGSMSDITVGSFVTVTLNSKGKVTNVLVSSRSSFAV